MSKVITIRVSDDLLERADARHSNRSKAFSDAMEMYLEADAAVVVEAAPDLAQHIAAGHHKKHHHNHGPVGEMADAPPARKQRTVAPRATPPSDGSPKESAGSNPVPDPKRIATSAVTAIGETVTPAADLRYARPAHDPRTCRNPFCLVCKKNDA